MTAKRLFASIFLSIAFALSPLAAQSIQAIHGSPEPQLDSADVYVLLGPLTVLELQDIDFRESNPYFSSPLGGLTLNFGVAPGNSTAAADTLLNFPFFLATETTYTGIIAGVQDPSSYAANPDGHDIGLDVFVYDQARMAGTTAGSIDLLVVHAVSDAPTVDIRLLDGTLLVDDIAYGDYSNYITVAPANYTLSVTDATGLIEVARFGADLSAYADSAITIAATGFLDPTANNDGPSLAVQGVLPSGDIIDFEPLDLTGIEDEGVAAIDDFVLAQNYPNPFNPSTTIEFTLGSRQSISLRIFNAVGQVVEVLVQDELSAGQHQYTWQASDVASGVYYYQLTSGNKVETRKMMLLK